MKINLHIKNFKKENLSSVSKMMFHKFQGNAKKSGAPILRKTNIQIIDPGCCSVCAT